MPDIVPNRRSRLELMRALVRAVGVGSLAVTVIGVLGCGAVGYIASCRDVTWAYLVVISAGPFLILVCGLWSLWENWLSFGVVEGLRPATFTPRSWLRVLAFVLLCSLAVLLLCAATIGSLSTEKTLRVAVGLAVCSFLGAGIPLMFMVGSPRYQLVREGLAVRHRGGRSLIPWIAIRSASLGSWSNNPVVAIQLEWSALPSPLETVWNHALGETARDRIQQKLLMKWISAARWGSANLMIMDIACMMPSGVFLVHLGEALQNPARRNALPAFNDQIGDDPSP